MALAANTTVESSTDPASGPDYYVNHLAEVNKTNEVVSTEDIYNKNGILLVRKGARISSDIAQKVVQHKLLKPLEEQVQLEQVVGAPAIQVSFDELANRYPDVRAIHEKLEFAPRLQKLLNNNEISPLLAQKLTVMKDRLPQRYENAVFCAWLSALVATQMKLGGDLVHAVFLAGLVHDVGLLHIEPEIINKTGQLSVSEWRAMQSHVVVGQMMLKGIRGIHPRAAIAVLEHHESCDGTGYPGGKLEDQLDVLGQIIGMADSLHAIRANQFEKCGRNLRDAIPYLRMNASTHTTGVHDAVHFVIKEANLPLSKVNPLGSDEVLVKHLIDRATQLQHVVAALEELQDVLLLGGTGADGKKLYKVVQPVVRMMRSSGILRDEIVQWLQSLITAPDESAIDDLTEMELMQNELGWQVKKVHRMLRETCERGLGSLSATDKSRLEQIAVGLGQATSPTGC